MLIETNVSVFFLILGSGGGIISDPNMGKLDIVKYLNLGKKYSRVYHLGVGDKNCKGPGISKFYDPGEEIIPCDGMITGFPAGLKRCTQYRGHRDSIMIGVNFYAIL